MKRTMLLMFLSLLGAAPLAMAHEGHEGQRMDRLSSKLGLDAEAKAKVEQTFERYRSQMQPLREDARSTREALKAELASARPDEARISTLTAQLQNDRRQLMTVGQQRSAELKTELTPSQYAKLMLARHHHFGRRGSKQ